MHRLKLPGDEDAVRDLLVGHTVVKVDDETLLLDDGRVLRLGGNEGCGGCPEGWYDITALNDCPVNAIMDVELDCQDSDDGQGDVFRLFVLAQDERIEVVTCEGRDNGWYGSGFWAEVQLNG